MRRKQDVDSKLAENERKGQKDVVTHVYVEYKISIAYL